MADNAKQPFFLSVEFWTIAKFWKFFVANAMI
jgi:hypothetical protein